MVIVKVIFQTLLKKAPGEELKFRDRSQSPKRQKYAKLDISLRVHNRQLIIIPRRNLIPTSWANLIVDALGSAYYTRRG